MKPYEVLITKDRFRRSEFERRTIDEEAQSDQARALYSSPFRRLQGKTQVFALEPNAAIRTRLTHSLEVSSVGRLIALNILHEFGDTCRALGLADGLNTAFVTFAETACLLHDIGNPPFGHYGELAIKEWFRANREAFKRSVIRKAHPRESQSMWETQYKDFEFFDGNPQGVRIVCLLQWHSDQFGLNLTKTQIASLVKYPVSTDNLRDWPKAGIFQTELSILEETWNSLELKRGCRHPIVLIMEASDDIGYCMSDIEDAIEKCIVTFAQFRDHMNVLFSRSVEPLAKTLMERLTPKLPGRSELLGFRTTLTRELAHYCAKEYVDNHQSILKGAHLSLFRKESLEHEILQHLRNFSNKYIYRARAIRDRELVATAVITGLLEAFKRLLLYNATDFRNGVTDKIQGTSKLATVDTYLDRFPLKHLEAYYFYAKDLHLDTHEGLIREWMLRAHLVVDYISGMTDEFAFEMHNLIGGVRKHGPV